MSEQITYGISGNGDDMDACEKESRRLHPDVWHRVDQRRQQAHEGFEGLGDTGDGDERLLSLALQALSSTSYIAMDSTKSVAQVDSELNAGQ